MSQLPSTTVLTEHLGYAPISLIDDVINAVNEILYDCTQAMENVLKAHYSSPEEEDEIELGTAKLETLLENAVDKCFDKYELYVLRNILTVPGDLIEGGWFRLEHHKGIDFASAQQSGQLDDTLSRLQRQLIDESRKTRKLQALNKHVEGARSLVEAYKQSIAFLSNPDDAQAHHALNQVEPLPDMIRFLSGKLQEIYVKVEALHRDLASAPVPKMTPSMRDEYIDEFTQRAMASAGIVSTDH